MNITIAGIVVLVGNYGSGKTEIAINLAAHRKQSGIDVNLVDLDLVNPYFRSREAVDILARAGVEVVIPDRAYFHADLPIVSPAVAGVLRRPAALTIVDAGGDDVGATVLASLADAFDKQPVHVLQVVNPLRPTSRSPAACRKIQEEIEAASKMTVSGLVGNANLLDDTTTETIDEGYRFMMELARESRLPLEFITADATLYGSLDPGNFGCPLLPIHRQLVPPWKSAARLIP
jgi:hypothetical protein